MLCSGTWTGLGLTEELVRKEIRILLKKKRLPNGAEVYEKK
jgi:hypothetical protein